MVEKTEAEKNLEKAKAYRFMGFIFAGAGFITFLIIYSRYMDGQPEKILTYLPNLIAVIVPFLPAWLFLRMAQKHYDMALDMLQTPLEPEADSSKPKK